MASIIRQTLSSVTDPFDNLFRSFALENEINVASANARYQDGVLELVLPKKVAASCKRLAVQ